MEEYSQIGNGDLDGGIRLKGNVSRRNYVLDKRLVAKKRETCTQRYAEERGVGRDDL